MSPSKVLIGTSTTLFHFFKCDEFDEVPGGPERYLMEDYSVDCDSPRYRAYVGFAGIMIFIYPIGIPLMYAALVWQHKKTLISKPALIREEKNGFPTVGHIRFLFQAYKPDVYFFEVVDCFRRLTLASIIGLLPTNSVASPTIAVILSLGFNFMFVHYKPYKTDADSRLAVTLSHSLTLIFFSAFLIKVRFRICEGSCLKVSCRLYFSSHKANHIFLSEYLQADSAPPDGSKNAELFAQLLCLVLASGPISLIIDKASMLLMLLLSIRRKEFKEKKPFKRRAEREGKWKSKTEDEEDAIHRDQSPEEGAELVVLDPELDMHAAAEVLWGHLRGYLQRKGGMELIEWFKGIDVDGSKKIDPDELYRAFCKIGISGASEDVVLRVALLADPDSSGQISYKAIVDAMGRLDRSPSWSGSTEQLARRVIWHKNPVLRHSMTVSEAHLEKVAMIDFLKSLKLSHVTGKFLEFGIDSMFDLADPDLVDDSTLAMTIGLTPDEIDNFRQGLAAAAPSFERYHQHKLELSVNRFELSEFLRPLQLDKDADKFFKHGLKTVTDATDKYLARNEILKDLGLSPTLIAAYRKHADRVRDDETSKLALIEFLRGVGLEGRADVFFKHGLGTVAYAMSEELVTDAMLANDLGLPPQEVKSYRQYAKMMREAQKNGSNFKGIALVRPRVLEDVLGGFD